MKLWYRLSKNDALFWQRKVRRESALRLAGKHALLCYLHSERSWQLRAAGVHYALEKMAALPERGSPPSANDMCSKSGWTKGELFVVWLHFTKVVKPEPENPDTHSSRAILPPASFAYKTALRLLLSHPTLHINFNSWMSRSIGY